jgi:hypothetical protein
VAVDFDARAVAAAHRTEVLLPFRRILLACSVAMIGFGGALLAYELYRLPIGLSGSSQVPSLILFLAIPAAFAAAGIFLLAECPALNRPLPTSYRLDSDGLTARWDTGAEVHASWTDPKLRLFLRDMRDLLEPPGATTLISMGGSFVPWAVPPELYDCVLSEVTKRGLVTKARFYRGRNGMPVHTATVRGAKTR